MTWRPDIASLKKLLRPRFGAAGALRITRALGFALGGATAVFVAAMLFLLATWDGVRVRNQIVDAVRERSGRAVNMAGEPRLRFTPAPEVVIRKLVLGERGRPGVALRVGELRLGLAVWPLVAGRVEVVQLDLADADIAVGRLPDGRLSLGDLLGDTGAPAPTSAIVFNVQRMGVERSRLQWEGDDAQPRFTLERLSASSGALSPGARGHLRMRATLNRMSGDASGGLQLDTGYRLGERLAELRLDDLALRFTGDAFGATALQAELSADEGSHGATGALELKRLKLGAKGRIGLRALDFSAQLASLQRQPGSLTLGNLRAALHAERDARRADLLVEAPGLRTLGSGQSGDDVTATLRASDGTQTLEAQLHAQTGYRSDSERIELSALDLRWKNAEALRNKGAWSGQLSGNATLSPLFERVELDLRGSVANNRAQLHARRDVASDNDAAWQYELALDALDNRLAVATASNSLAGPAAWLAAVSARGQWRIDTMQLGALRLGGLDARVISGNGRLGFERVDARFYGGHLSGSANYTSAARQFDTDLRFEGVALASLLGDLHRRMPVNGEADGQLQASFQPGPWPTIARSLQGSLQWGLRKGSWQGMAFPDLLRSVRPALKDRSSAERPAQSGESQGFERLQASCQFGETLAQCSNLAGEGGWWRIGGQGSVQLVDGNLDWLVRLAVQSQGGTPRDLAGLRGVTVPLRLQGPAHRAGWRLDWSAVAPRPAPARSPRPAASQPINPDEQAGTAG